MSWNKTEWFDLIGNDIAKHIIGANDIAVGDIDCNGDNTYVKVSIKVVVLFGANPQGNVEVEMYSVDAGLAEEADTLPLWKQALDNLASSEGRVTIPNLDVSALDTLRIVVRNNDGTNSVSTWVSFYAAHVD